MHEISVTTERQDAADRHHRPQVREAVDGATARLCSSTSRTRPPAVTINEKIDPVLVEDLETALRADRRRTTGAGGTTTRTGRTAPRTGEPRWPAPRCSIPLARRRARRSAATRRSSSASSTGRSRARCTSPSSSRADAADRRRCRGSARFAGAEGRPSDGRRSGALRASRSGCPPSRRRCCGRGGSTTTVRWHSRPTSTDRLRPTSPSEDDSTRRAATTDETSRRRVGYRYDDVAGSRSSATSTAGSSSVATRLSQARSGTGDTDFQAAARDDLSPTTAPDDIEPTSRRCEYYSKIAVALEGVDLSSVRRRLGATRSRSWRRSSQAIDVLDGRARPVSASRPGRSANCTNG